jgi:hypothetical protein
MTNGLKMRFAIIFSLFAVFGITGPASAAEPETVVSASFSWKFGGKHSALPALGLKASFGSGYAHGPRVELAGLSWKPNDIGEGGFNASLVGVPVVVDSARADVTAGNVATGIGLGTVTLVVLGSAAVAAILRDAPEEIARCVASPECRDDDQQNDQDNSDDQPSDEGRLPGV